MTPPHSPLPWTVKRALAGDLTIVDAHGVPIIAEDGAITPEDAALIVTAVNNYDRMKAALEEIAHKPSVALRGKRGMPRWATVEDTIGMACEVLGLCRECRKPLTTEGRGCHVCGAALASPDDGWVKVDEEHPLPDDLKPGDETRCIFVSLEQLINAPSGSFTDSVLTHYRRRPSAEQGG